MLDKPQISALRESHCVLQNVIDNSPLEQSERGWAMIQWYGLRAGLNQFESEFHRLLQKYEELHGRFKEFDFQLTQLSAPNPGVARVYSVLNQISFR